MTINQKCGHSYAVMLMLSMYYSTLQLGFHVANYNNKDGISLTVLCIRCLRKSTVKQNIDIKNIACLFDTIAIITGKKKNNHGIIDWVSPRFTSGVNIAISRTWPIYLIERNEDRSDRNWKNFIRYNSTWFFPIKARFNYVHSMG